ncbi:Ribosomal large subunit pseudouridine synthase [Rickettsiales endosymbiont of Paramecium tredecaurelia]|uniref:pseudouridine synthase n=1 Tax=Candidatus Sarmatiella mevalonica TaxID=2770581 RepID=UPI001923AA23|nr:pseudouridine synthase [Candidatus Sarmatiella mevalonica]MBL3284206.1 Ribosomal large subunit pseudouridine synthase [Candidatus Sarmatiella mevalonica]
MTQRLAKIIAAHSVYSRRDAERLILDARVDVDGIVVSEVGFKIGDVAAHKICIDGELLNVSDITQPAVWLYYKPVGVITSARDPQGRDCVFERVKGRYAHLAQQKMISVGRLDINSEGLLILTNSGQFARYLELPQNKIAREYKVRVYCKKNYIEEMFRYFKNNKTVSIDCIDYSLDSISLISSSQNHHWLKLILWEGKNREIRKICTFFHAQVSRLIRVGYGPFKLGDLKPDQVANCSSEMIKKYFPQLY